MADLRKEELFPADVFGLSTCRKRITRGQAAPPCRVHEMAVCDHISGRSSLKSRHQISSEKSSGGSRQGYQSSEDRVSVFVLEMGFDHSVFETCP